MKRKIYKLLSILLALMIVFSACACVIGTVSAADATLYVKNGGNDSRTGKNPNNQALATIAGAINKANSYTGSNALTASDTLYIKCSGNKEISWDANTGEAVLPAHVYKVVIKSNSTSTQSTVGGQRSVLLGGPTDFEDIKIAIDKSGNNWNALCYNGYDVNIASSVTFSTQQFQTALGKRSGTFNSANAQNFVVNTPVTSISLANDMSTATYNHNVYVEYNAASGKPSFRLGSNYGTGNFNAALNVNIKAATEVAFSKPTLEGNFAFGENGYMQVLNATSTVLNATAGVFSEIDSSKLWILNNDLQATDLISLTETKGKYAVNTSVYNNIKAISAADSSVEVNAVGGFLTLPAGVWTVTAEKIPQVKTYYVKADATDGDGSAEKPFANIAAAVSQGLTDGLIKGDILNVLVDPTAEVTWCDNRVTTTMPSHAFKLVVKSSSDTEIATVSNGLNLNADGTPALNSSGNTSVPNVSLGGPTELVSVKAKGSSGLRIANNDFTVDENSSFDVWYVNTGTSSTGGVEKEVKGQNITINGSLGSMTFDIGNDYHTNVYTDALNIKIARGKAKIGFSGHNITKFNAPVNIMAQNVSELSFNAKQGMFEFQENGALQIFNSSSATVNADEGTLENIPDDKKYIINNKTGDHNILTPTKTIGKYEVFLANPKHVLVATNSKTGAQITYDGSGFLTLPAGQYELRIVRDPIYKYYYVANDGIVVSDSERPATAGTKENPVKTYADATRLIAQDGLTDIDVAVVLLKSGEKIDWSNTILNDKKETVSTDNPASFACTLVIDSTDPTDKATLYSYPSVGLTGNTIFKNVIFKLEYQWGSFNLAGKNLTIEEGAEVTVPTTYLWRNVNNGTVRQEDITVTVNGCFITGAINLRSEYHSNVIQGDLNFVINNADTAATFNLGGGTGSSADHPHTYNGDINITILKAKSMAFGISSAGATVNGALQLLVDDSVSFPYSVKTNFNSLDVAGGKWYITNAASSDDFVTFGNAAGKFNIKGGKTAYYRQYGTDQKTVKGGELDFSTAPGAYTVSDKAIAELVDDSHKMLHFSVPGGAHHMATRARIVPGETYIYEYSIYSTIYEDTTPCARDDGDRGVTATPEIISEEKIGDYYRIVCEVTIPEDYKYGSWVFFGLNLPSYAEGFWFDRTVYNKNDPEKTDLFEGNTVFHNGLDYVALDMAFWGKVFTGTRGGEGICRWDGDFQFLEIVNFSEETIKELIRAADPDDGEWWNKADLIEEKTYITYADAKGTFKDELGNPVKGIKMALISADNTYTSTTNSKGEFKFDHIVTGFYELYIVDGKENIFTGFSSFIDEEDVVTFDIVTDLSGLRQSNDGIENDNTQTDYETVTEGEEVEEIVPSGNLSGTVYTPFLETVSGLKICLDGVGEVVTDENGNFAFANVPVGKYKLYTVLENGSEYVFRDVEIEENVDLAVKLKYDPAVETDNDGQADNGWIIWVIIASVIALVVVAALIFFLIFKKKKAEQN